MLLSSFVHSDILKYRRHVISRTKLKPSTGIVEHMDGTKVFEEDGRNWKRRQEDSPCYLDWSVVSRQIRKTRSSRHRSFQQIVVNGVPEYDNAAPGVYVNNPRAIHDVVSFQYDRMSTKIECPKPTEKDCFFFNGGKCVQYSREFEEKLRQCEKAKSKSYPLLCDYVSSVTLVPRSIPGAAHIDTYKKEEESRQREVCDCNTFSRCLLMNGFYCGWREWVNPSQDAKSSEFCMNRKCSLVLDGSGNLVRNLGLNSASDMTTDECYNMWSQGREHSDFFFTIRSVSVPPELLHRAVPRLNLPTRTFPSSTSAPTADWKCTYTMITFYQFSNDKWGRSAGCDNGNVFDVTGKSMTKKSGNTHDQVPAWMRRERHSSRMRFRRHLID